MKTYTPSEALDLARLRQVWIEPVVPKAMKTKAAAQAKVPRGGILIRDDEGWIPAELRPR